MLLSRLFFRFQSGDWAEILKWKLTSRLVRRMLFKLRQSYEPHYGITIWEWWKFCAQVCSWHSTLTFDPNLFQKTDAASYGTMNNIYTYRNGVHNLKCILRTKRLVNFHFKIKVITQSFSCASCYHAFISVVFEASEWRLSWNFKVEIDESFSWKDALQVKAILWTPLR